MTIIDCNINMIFTMMKIIYRYLFNKDTYYNENQNPILLTIDDFTILIKKIIEKLK